MIVLKEVALIGAFGRELYTAPFIWVNVGDVNIYDTQRKDKYGKPIYSTKDKFYVNKIAIQDKKIIGLSIWNQTLKKRVFVYDISKE